MQINAINYLRQWMPYFSVCGDARRQLELKRFLPNGWLTLSRQRCRTFGMGTRSLSTSENLRGHGLNFFDRKRSKGMATDVTKPACSSTSRVRPTALIEPAGASSRHFDRRRPLKAVLRCGNRNYGDAISYLVHVVTFCPLGWNVTHGAAPRVDLNGASFYDTGVGHDVIGSDIFSLGFDKLPSSAQGHTKRVFRITHAAACCFHANYQL